MYRMNRMKARFIRFILYILLKSAFLKYNPVSMPKKLPPQAVLLNMTIGHWVARLIHVAAKLRIADHLRKGPRTAADLATAARVQGAPLYRVLRALSSVGVFAETKDGRFKLTPLAALLRTDVPDSMNGWAMMINEPYNWKAWCEVLHSVQTGENAFQKAYGMNFFERLERHPEDLAVFGESMTSLSRAENPAVAAACKLKGKGTIVDVRRPWQPAGRDSADESQVARRVVRSALGHRAGQARRPRDGQGYCCAMPPGRRKLLRIGAEGRRRLHHEVHPARLG